MIVYVESNFILEIALQQEEAIHANGILDLAEAGRIDLVIPAFALSEPFPAVMHRGSERARVCTQLASQLSELGRSKPHRDMAARFQEVPTALLEIVRQETNRLVDTVQRLLDISERVEMTALSFQEAQSYEAVYGLSMQDAIIYSAVIDHLRRLPSERRKCFLSRNSRDFHDPGITSELESINCKYLPRFEDGLNYINSKIGP